MDFRREFIKMEETRQEYKKKEEELEKTINDLAKVEGETYKKIREYIEEEFATVKIDGGHNNLGLMIDYIDISPKLIVITMQEQIIDVDLYELNKLNMNSFHGGLRLNHDYGEFGEQTLYFTILLE